LHLLFRWRCSSVPSDFASTHVHHSLDYIPPPPRGSDSLTSHTTPHTSHHRGRGEGGGDVTLARNASVLETMYNATARAIGHRRSATCPRVARQAAGAWPARNSDNHPPTPPRLALPCQVKGPHVLEGAGISCVPDALAAARGRLGGRALAHRQSGKITRASGRRSGQTGFDLACHRHEGLLDVGGRLGRGLEERHGE